MAYRKRKYSNFNKPKYEVENRGSILTKSKAFDVPVKVVHNFEIAFRILQYDNSMILNFGRHS